MKYILTYLLFINIIGFTSMYIDKQKAIKGKWRIKEATLFSIAIIGGSIGVLFGMYQFRHKTKHLSFKLGIPSIILIQILIIGYIIK